MLPNLNVVIHWLLQLPYLEARLSLEAGIPNKEADALKIASSSSFFLTLALVMGGYEPLKTEAELKTPFWDVG